MLNYKNEKLLNMILKIQSILILSLIMVSISWSNAQSNFDVKDYSLIDFSRGDLNMPFDPILAPFYHGVASGDPLNDAVVIWTRITPMTDQTIAVDWEMAQDTSFSTIIASGQTSTDQTKDYTVKLDVNGLNAGTTYYYRFTALGTRSITGRTKTASTGNIDQLKFGVVSCNNYQSGYFNAFARLAERNDLDGVIHLGDFIYEYETGGYGYDPDVGREHLPETEILTLGDYRIRYSHYRLDADLRRAMQQHPFILIWDDHEVANDSYDTGAQNHTPDEGDYAQRKAQAIQAYFEWVPVRDLGTQRVYRSVQYGDLLDLVMLDTRHEARTIQVDSITDPNIADPNRFLLGPQQMNWFKSELSNSSATWKVVGNQIVFSPVLFENVEPFFPGASNLFLDVWNGYPAKRTEVINYIKTENIDNVFFVTGDVHISLGFDVTEDPIDTLSYNPTNGMGSVAVETVTPSISSDNYDEILGETTSTLLGAFFESGNPHNEYFDFNRHGYLVLDLTPSQAQSDYFYVPSVREPNQTEQFECGLYTLSGSNHLIKTNTPAPPKTIQEIPAPDPTLLLTPVNQVENNLLLLTIFPNPTSNFIQLNYALLEAGNLNIQLLDANGRTLKSIKQGNELSGNYKLTAEVSDLPTGIYFIVLEHEGQRITRKLIKK